MVPSRELLLIGVLGPAGLSKLARKGAGCRPVVCASLLLRPATGSSSNVQPVVPIIQVRHASQRRRVQAGRHVWVQKMRRRAASSGLASLWLTEGLRSSALKSLWQLNLARCVLREPTEELAEHALSVLVLIPSKSIGFHQGLKPCVFYRPQLRPGRTEWKNHQSSN